MPFTVFFHVLICGIVLVTLLLSLDTLPEDSHHQGEYYALITFGAVGMCLMTSAVELACRLHWLGDFFHRHLHPCRISQADRHADLNPRSSTSCSDRLQPRFLLYGIAMVFGATGTTSVYEIARNASTAQNQSLVHAALALMLVGILFKVSAVPFHIWTPDVYEGAPSPVVALMSTAPKAAAFAFLLRIVYEMFPTLRAVWSPVLWVVAVLSMTVGNLAALRQQNVKRMLAYSSIAHAGYLLAAFAAFGTSGIAAASFYTAAYAAMNVGIFAVVTLAGGYDDERPLIAGLQRIALPVTAARQPADLLSRVARRNSLHRRILRQVLFLLGRGWWRSSCAGHHRIAEFGIGGGILSAAGICRCTASR